MTPAVGNVGSHGEWFSGMQNHRDAARALRPVSARSDSDCAVSSRSRFGNQYGFISGSVRRSIQMIGCARAACGVPLPARATPPLSGAPPRWYRPLKEGSRRHTAEPEVRASDRGPAARAGRERSARRRDATAATAARQRTRRATRGSVTALKVHPTIGKSQNRDPESGVKRKDR